jgi:putative membrane protein
MMHAVSMVAAQSAHAWAWSWGGWWLWWLFWAALIGVGVWLWARSPWRRGGSDQARELLALRYARGEISTDEYRERLSEL